MKRLSLFAAAATAASALSLPTPALACGGFFCSAANPVNQTAEQIVFAQNDDGTVTAVIQIAYQGPSESFAWVLPIKGIPTVGVSSDSAIQSLTYQTDPLFILDPTTEGQCQQAQYAAEADGAVLTTPPTPGAAAPNTGVTVLAEGSVGPYDYVAIEPQPGLADPAQVALDWLNENGYDTTSISSEVLGPYLSEGMNLIAFRLTKGNQVGSIRPVMITYEGSKPSIPIRPTAVAASADMGVRVWVLGKSRAIPENYLGLELNEARIDWFYWQNNYDQVVSEAADEAGGHGFVTEFSGDSDQFRKLVWTDYNDQAWESYNSMQFDTAFDRMSAAASMFRGWDGVRDAIGAATTLPPGVTLDEFGRNPESYRNDPNLVIDEDLFQQKLIDWVIEPVRQTQKLIDDHPHMTRLYTTLSPDEMTDDPLFSFNPDLPDVSREHHADITYYCNPNIYQWEAPWKIRLQSGVEFTGMPNLWPVELADAPAAARIMTLSESGPADVMVDNSDAILATVGDVPVADGAQEPMNPPPAAKSSSGSSGFCALTRQGTAPHWLAFGWLLVGAALFRRRRA
jgi:hypothetical protein